jgi:hypothetical protein
MNILINIDVFYQVILLEQIYILIIQYNLYIVQTINLTCIGMQIRTNDYQNH